MPQQSTEKEGQRRFDKADQRTAKILTNKIFKRVRGNPKLRGVTWDDIYSDVCMTWVACRDNFKPELGVSFATYFSNCVMHNVSGLVTKRLRAVDTVSIDTDGGSDDEEDSMHEMFADPSEDVEAQVAQRQRLRRLAGRFPLLVACMELVLNEPDELAHEIKAYQEYTARCKERGFCMDTPSTALTLNILPKIFGFNWRQRQILHQEMERAAQYIG